MKGIRAVPFHNERVQESVVRSPLKTSKEEEIQTSDSQNTTVNMMRRSSSFRSLKSSFPDHTDIEYSLITIEFLEDFCPARIRQVVSTAGRRKEFRVQVVAEHRIILIKSNPSSWRQLYSCCMGGQLDQTVLTVDIKSDVLSRIRTLHIKFLEGSFPIFDDVVKLIQETLKDLDKSSTLTSNKVIPSFDSAQSLAFGSTNPDQSLLWMQSKGYVAIQRIMSPKYMEYLGKFKLSLKQIQGKVLSNTLGASELINQLLRTVNKIYEEVYPQLSTFHPDIVYYSIERFVCLNCIQEIKDFYIQTFRQQEQVLTAKKDKILSQWSNQQIINYLQIKPQFQLIVESDPSHIPYSASIKILQTLNMFTSLRDKLRVVQEFYSSVKVSCYEFHRGKQQISTMDDILPVVIYTVVNASVAEFYAQLKMIDDYARACGRFEADQRVITNLFVGVEYVSKEWSLQ